MIEYAAILISVAILIVGIIVLIAVVRSEPFYSYTETRWRDPYWSDRIDLAGTPHEAIAAFDNEEILREKGLIDAKNDPEVIACGIKFRPLGLSRTISIPGELEFFEAPAQLDRGLPKPGPIRRADPVLVSTNGYVYKI